MKYLLPIVLLALLFTTACKDDDGPMLSFEEQKQADRVFILDYLSTNNINADSTDSGLFYAIDVAGVGGNPNVNSEVTVKYKGFFMDDNMTVFDQTPGSSTVKFRLTGVIPGWTEGIQLMKPGSQARFYIPSHLAYGSNGSGSIPGNTPIAFDVELVSYR